MQGGPSPAIAQAPLTAASWGRASACAAGCCSGLAPAPGLQVPSRLGRRHLRPARVTVGSSACSASVPSSSSSADAVSESRCLQAACHLRRCCSLCLASRWRQDLHTYDRSAGTQLHHE